jgi:hypothetical protein
MTESDGPMPAPPQPHASEPLRASLSDADDRLRLNHWMALQQGVAPRIRIGRRWINSLWGLPIGAAALLCLIALAQSLRELPGVAAFIRQHPGIAQSAPSVDSGIPHPSAGIYRSDSLKQGTRARYTVNGSSGTGLTGYSPAISAIVSSRASTKRRSRLKPNMTTCQVRLRRLSGPCGALLSRSGRGPSLHVFGAGWNCA